MSTRYTVLGTLASGGMGTVFLARRSGSAGFSRLVAIKRLNPELAAQKEFIAMLVDEARLASSLHHVNIIDTLDLVATDGAFSLVLEYIEGAALSVLQRDSAKAGEPIPLPIILSLVTGMLRGLDAAHDARSPEGSPLGIVHRDISPQNVLVGVDGVPRIIDFGIAKAMGRVVQTRPGEVRGKFAYMAPEQLLERPATRQADVYAAGVVLWELLTGQRLFNGEDARAVCAAVLRGEIQPPSALNPSVPKALDEVVLRATARETGERYYSARELLDALAAFERASDDDVGRWVRATAAVYLAKRAEMLQNHTPDHSRSVEDLMAELQASATPSEGVNVPTPPTQRPPMINVRSTLPLPMTPPPDPPSARGLTSAGVVVTSVAGSGLPSAVKAGPLIAIGVAVVVCAIGLGAFLLGRRETPTRELTFTSEPVPLPSTVTSVEAPATEPAVSAAPPEPPPELAPVAATRAPAPGPAAEAPPASASHVTPKRPPAPKGTPTKKPAHPSDPFIFR